MPRRETGQNFFFFQPSCLHRTDPDQQIKTQLSYAIPQTSRSISTARSRWQQSPPEPRDIPQDPRPSVLPIATATVTANVTAAPPEAFTTPSDQKRTSKLPEASTAEMQRQIASSMPREDLTTALARRLRRTARATTETYITYGVTESLFKSCSAQAPYTIPEEQRMGMLTGTGPAKTAGGEDLGHPEVPGSWWFNELALPPTFSTWSQITYLHMYLLTVRLRAMEPRSAFLNYQRYLIEHFSHAAEDKMLILHGMNARSIRNKYLRDLFLQWRGLLAAYDEGLVKGDAVLAGAVWRNLWKGDQDVDWEKVAVVVGYMRRTMVELEKVDIEELVSNLGWQTTGLDSEPARPVRCGPKAERRA